MTANRADLINEVVQQLQQTLQSVQQSHAGLIQANNQLAQAISKPKRVVRDEEGKIVGVQ